MNEQKSVWSCPGCESLYSHSTDAYTYFSCGSKVDNEHQWANRTLRCRMLALERRLDALESRTVEPLSAEAAMKDKPVPAHDSSLKAWLEQHDKSQQDLREAHQQLEQQKVAQETSTDLQILEQQLQAIGSRRGNYPNVYLQAAAQLKYWHHLYQDLQASVSQLRREKDKLYQDKQRLMKERNAFQERLAQVQFVLDGKDGE